MIRLYSCLLSVAIIFLTSACGTLLSKSHLKMIEEGGKPKLATIVSVSDQIYVEYYEVASMNYEAEPNCSFNYPSVLSFRDEVIKSTNDILKRDNLVDLYTHKPGEEAELLNSLEFELPYYWKNEVLSKEDTATIASWGKSRNLDYVAFIIPRIMRRSVYSPQRITEKVVTGGQRGMNMRAVAYGMRLFDVNAENWADIITGGAFIRKNPPFVRKLSEQEINTIKSERDANSLADVTYNAQHLSLQEQLLRASYFTCSDYANLTITELEKIDNSLLPYVREAITKLLVKAGIAKGKSRPTWTSYKMPSVERIAD